MQPGSHIYVKFETSSNLSVDTLQKLLIALPLKLLYPIETFAT
jgi:hypothetical protein